MNPFQFNNPTRTLPPTTSPGGSQNQTASRPAPKQLSLNSGQPSTGSQGVKRRADVQLTPNRPAKNPLPINVQQVYQKHNQGPQFSNPRTLRITLKNLFPNAAVPDWQLDQLIENAIARWQNYQQACNEIQAGILDWQAVEAHLWQQFQSAPILPDQLAQLIREAMATYPLNMVAGHISAAIKQFMVRQQKYAEDKQALKDLFRQAPIPPNQLESLIEEAIANYPEGPQVVKHIQEGIDRYQEEMLRYQAEVQRIQAVKQELMHHFKGVMPDAQLESLVEEALANYPTDQQVINHVQAGIERYKDTFQTADDDLAWLYQDPIDLATIIDLDPDFMNALYQNFTDDDFSNGFVPAHTSAQLLDLPVAPTSAQLLGLSTAPSSAQLLGLPTAPTSTQSQVRPAINAAKDHPEFTSNVPPGSTPVDLDKVFDKWKKRKLTKKTFYEEMRKLLKSARDPNAPDHAAAKDTLDELLLACSVESPDGKKNNKLKKLILDNVRVTETKAFGAVGKNGQDELFQTAATLKYLEYSYRPPAGKSATALFNGEEFDWMDAQQQIRLSTEFIIWAGDLVGAISGHTGTFQDQFQSNWMTVGQAKMHEVRDGAIDNRSNPANAIAEALTTHLRVTLNVADLAMDMYKSPKAKQALMTSGISVEENYDKIKEWLGRHRNALKDYLTEFTKDAKHVTPSSPMVGNLGGDDYYPPSPKQTYADGDPQYKATKVKGNPLKGLADQWRLNYDGKMGPIPKKPKFTFSAQLNTDLEKVLSKDEVKKIVAAAQRAQKAERKSQDEQDDSDEVKVANVGIETCIKKIRERLGSERDQANRVILAEVVVELEKLRQ